MIKFLGGGGKRSEPEKPPSLGKGFLPTDKVKELSTKGFAEPEIIDVLRKDGFSSEEIDRALTQSLKIGVTGEEESQNLPTLKDLNYQEGNDFQNQGEQFLPSLPMPQQQPMMPQEQQYASNLPPQMAQPQEYYSQPQQPELITEELVESIIHERMGELDDRLGEFKNKYNDLERKILDLHNRLVIVSKGRTDKDEEIISKIDSFKDTLEDMNARLSGLEKTFKEALPALIESVHSLTDLVHEMRRNK